MTQMFDIIARKLDGLNMYQAIDVAVLNHKEELEDLNTFQLDKGLDSEDKNLGQYKSIAYKGRLSPVDLKDDGDFRGSINAISKQGQITMSATDWKYPILSSEKKWGKDIVGIPKSDLVKGTLKGILLDDIQKEARKQLDGIS